MKKITLVAVLLGTAQLMYAQEITIPASGGEVTGTGGAVSYTVGQLVHANPTKTSSLSQGIQRGIEQLITTYNKL